MTGWGWKEEEVGDEHFKYGEEDPEGGGWGAPVRRN